jgi:hypothetical protein
VVGRCGRVYLEVKRTDESVLNRQVDVGDSLNDMVMNSMLDLRN